MSEKLQEKLAWAVILSETSHIFCCVLPTVFSVMSLMVGLGLVGAVPTFLLDAHDVMHKWEVPVITMSGLVVALGWAVVWYNKKHKCCHHTGCHHEPCTPKKTLANKILIVASVLFVINISVYFGLHRPMDKGELDHDHVHQEEFTHPALQ